MIRLLITILNFLSLMVSVSGLETVTLNKDNHVSLLGTVNKTSIDKLMRDIYHLDKRNFYLYINSPGGYVEDGERFVSHLQFLQETGKNISCIAENAHSMAYYIFQN